MYTSVQDAASWAMAMDKHIQFSDKEEELTLRKIEIVKNQSNAFSHAVWVVENYQGHLITGHSGGPALGDIIRFPKEKLTIIVLNNQNYVLPYMAKAFAFYVKGLKMHGEPKRFNREDVQ
jgi:serine-type D-Ala-D-Ala carboxypeptidase